MQGKAQCKIQDRPDLIHEFSNISLTYISREKLAVISKNGKEPREILSLHGARVDVMSSGEIEVNGFLKKKGEKNVFRKCRIVFYGNAVRAQEAS